MENELEIGAAYYISRVNLDGTVNFVSADNSDGITLVYIGVEGDGLVFQYTDDGYKRKLVLSHGWKKLCSKVNFDIGI